MKKPIFWLIKLDHYTPLACLTQSFFAINTKLRKWAVTSCWLLWHKDKPRRITWIFYGDKKRTMSILKRNKCDQSMMLINIFMEHSTLHVRGLIKKKLFSNFVSYVCSIFAFFLLCSYTCLLYNISHCQLVFTGKRLIVHFSILFYSKKWIKEVVLSFA